MHVITFPTVTRSTRLLKRFERIAVTHKLVLRFHLVHWGYTRSAIRQLLLGNFCAEAASSRDLCRLCPWQGSGSVTPTAIRGIHFLHPGFNGQKTLIITAVLHRCRLCYRQTDLWGEALARTSTHCPRRLYHCLVNRRFPPAQVVSRKAPVEYLIPLAISLIPCEKCVLGL